MIEIYTGKPIKTTAKDGVYEIIEINNTTEEVICRPINSIDNGLETFRISTIREL